MSCMPPERRIARTMRSGSISPIQARLVHCFQVRSGNTSDGPWTYTVEAGQSLSDSWAVGPSNQGKYDLSVYGPNGFLRSFSNT